MNNKGIELHPVQSIVHANQNSLSGGSRSPETLTEKLVQDSPGSPGSPCGPGVAVKLVKGSPGNPGVLVDHQDPKILPVVVVKDSPGSPGVLL